MPGYLTTVLVVMYAQHVLYHLEIRPACMLIHVPLHSSNDVKAPFEIFDLNIRTGL